MKLSYEWLSEYLDLNIEPKDLAEKIERTAVEVDSVKRLDYKLKKIVVGHTLEVEMHPDSDHLHIVQVDVGEEEPIQIVCGAPNIAADQDVIVAMHGSRIKDNVKIKRSKMRGVPSNGMICALQEIGFDDAVVPKDYVDGIYVFPADSGVEPGDSVMEALGMDDDVIDTDITPNRGDMFSMNGNATEIGAILNEDVTFESIVPSDSDQSDQDSNEQISVKVSDPVFAPVYKMKVINNLTVEDSPFWLQKRLMKAGIRPINNLVDVTNYIMLKYGQPLHAFDYDQLPEKTITVDKAGENVKFTTLDGEERDLRADDLLIKSGDVPVALAGVMGGMDSEISDGTKTVALEAAIFDPILVRKTARYHVLHSEAATRFERGIDFSSIDNALDEAATMMAQLGNGQISQNTVVGNEVIPEEKQIKISLVRINKVLGTELSADEVGDIFDRLGFEYDLDEVNGNFNVVAPLRRWDISIEADLLEEIARIYGYDNLPSTLPVGPTTIGSLTDTQKIIRDSRTTLEGLGLNQAMSYGLTTIDKARHFIMADGETVKVDWPMTKDHEALRMSLISGLLDDIAYNEARSVDNIALYEQGRVFKKAGDNVQPTEIEHIAGAITGSLIDSSWINKDEKVDFYQMKGVVDQYLQNLNLNGAVQYRATDQYPEMHPGRTANIFIDDQYIGFVGQVHPETQKAYKISETYVFELNLSTLIAQPKVRQHYEMISKFPSISRDMALLVDEDVTNQNILDVINSSKQKFLVNINLFDVYNGSHLPSGKKSLGYQLTYQDSKATLQEEVVNQEFESLVEQLKTELGVTIR
ncbi:phenylalanine--tRNA ligase subunit beta [Pediococcus argentinicus]|uniref:Phenylalanine--tRNA ligase beta subunit n=1 Tax=Pediococcus argentinicus TaxID=480391 RepID=A0A0R2NNF7_9LACO|nr:phenylalanine--tRNA ligase subunit beta [Pediococcus argentinicus]KRO25379.1 pheT protein [Pediococcus argentinicus]NKZ22297.1 phenylalanine--tRNA ligase subunit beta [Pediococcus argentinicus]GEP19338.1 phenylalanine--tRNA ligase beta subunit [Pediococcus argentinicus]